MKKILIYVSPASWIGSLYSPFESEFRHLGYDVIVMDVNAVDYLKVLLETFENNDVYFSIGHNDLGININFSDGEGLYEKLPVPHVAVLDDPPYNPIEFGMRGARCKKLIVGVRDRSHIECLKMESSYPSHKGLFIPHWSAVQPEKENLEYDRDIDILNSATYYGRYERIWREWDNITVANLLDDVADCLDLESITIYQAFFKVLRDRKMEEYIADCYKYFTCMYNYIKTYRREKCLESLIEAGMRITVCDKTWKKSRLADSLNFIGQHSYEETLELYKRTKVLIQENAEFDSGIHERMLNAMLCGATVVSEYSDYAAEEFQDGKDLLFYRWDKLDEIPFLVNRLLNNRFERQYMSCNAFEKVANNHLPKHRAKKILEAVGLSF